MVWLWLGIGATGTLGGAALLVTAFRTGQAGDKARERFLFRWAVGALALGSAAFLFTMIVSTPHA